MFTRRTVLGWLSALATLVAGSRAVADIPDDVAALAAVQTERYKRLPPIERYQRVMDDLTRAAHHFDDQNDWELGYTISRTAFEAIANDLGAIPRPTRPHLLLVDEVGENMVVVGLPEGFDWIRVLALLRKNAA